MRTRDDDAGGGGGGGDGACCSCMMHFTGPALAFVCVDFRAHGGRGNSEVGEPFVHPQMRIYLTPNRRRSILHTEGERWRGVFFFLSFFPFLRWSSRTPA